MREKLLNDAVEALLEIYRLISWFFSEIESIFMPPPMFFYLQ